MMDLDGGYADAVKAKLGSNQGHRGCSRLGPLCH